MTVERKTVSGKPLRQTDKPVPGHLRKWVRTQLAHEAGVQKAFVFSDVDVKLTLDGVANISPPEDYRIRDVNTSGRLTHIWIEAEDDR